MQSSKCLTFLQANGFRQKSQLGWRLADPKAGIKKARLCQACHLLIGYSTTYLNQYPPE